MKNPDKLSGIEDIEAQRSLFDVIQFTNANTLGEMGITTKAARSLRGEVCVWLDTRPVLQRLNSDEGVVEMPSIRLTVLKDMRQESSGRYAYLPVAWVTNGVVKPVNGFFNREVTTVIDMLAGLQEAKDSGVLPNLAPDLGDIYNPLNAIAKQG